jgi:chemotaxis response regulator CheB
MTMTAERILVVDDEPRYVGAIQVNLEVSGYEVLAARDGQTAIELAADEEPDLIVLDIRMPGLDGFEACRRIREFSTVPIIMLTGLGFDGTNGAGDIKAAGGKVIAEHESTSVIYGMPRSVVEAGLADWVVPLPDVAAKLVNLVS